MTKNQPSARAARFANLDLVEVEASGSEGTTFVEVDHLSDLSRTGVFILTDSPLPIGARVTLRFVLAGKELRPIEVAGEVVRISAPHTVPDERGMGIQFTEPPPDVEAAIDSVIKDELSPGDS